MSQDIEKKIIELEKIISESTLDEGITVVSGALAHILSMAINQNAFDRNRLHDYFEELEARIMRITKDTAAQSKIKGIRRDV